MQQPVDLLEYYEGRRPELLSAERRDPEFCRTALQLCHDLCWSMDNEQFLELALLSVLKQATWPRRGLFRFLGPVWLDYNMAHSNIGPFYNQDRLLHLAKSIAMTARNYRQQLFGNHSSARYHQRRLKGAILFFCMAIERGAPQAYFAALPRLDASGPQA